MQSFKDKKGMKIAHVEASSVIPPTVATELYENMPEKAAGKARKSDLLRNLPKEKRSRLQKFLKV